MLFRAVRALHHKVAGRVQTATPENMERRQFLVNGMNAGILGMASNDTVLDVVVAGLSGTAMPGYWGPPSRLGVPSEITSTRLARA